LSNGFDLGESEFFAVAADESLYVESGALLWVLENFWGDDFAIETKC
jgi:hypothetical protein